MRATRPQLRSLDDTDFRRLSRSADLLVFGALTIVAVLSLLLPPWARLLAVVVVVGACLFYISKVGRLLLAERRRRARR